MQGLHRAAIDRSGDGPTAPEGAEEDGGGAMAAWDEAEASRNPRMAGDTTRSPATSKAVNDDVRDVAAARAGSHEAFARIYDRHAPVVLSLCRRGLYGSLTEAEDATQETFIRAHRLLHKLDDPCRLRPWLYGIAKRVSSERRRSLNRRKNHEGQAMTNATA